MVLRRLGIAHRLKVGKNDLATLDRKIGMLQEALFKDAADKGTRDWASRVAKVVAGINQTPTEPLMGSAPDDVEDDSGILEFALRRQGAADLQQNEKISKQRIDKVTDAGAFRVEIPAPDNFARGFKPRFADKIHQDQEINRTSIVGTDGPKTYPLKYVQPVAPDSTAVRAQASAGSAQHSDRARRELLPYANRVVAQFRGSTIRIQNVGALLSRDASFVPATRRASLKQRGVVSRFLRVFPEFFIINSERGGSVEVKG